MSMAVNLLHLGALALGFFAIVRLERKEKLARFFWPLVAIACATMAVGVFAISDPADTFEDFRRAYWEAGAAVWRGSEGFEAVYARGTDGFVNLPIIAFLFAPFGLVDAHVAAKIFALLGVAAAIWSWRQISVYFALSRRDRALLALAMAGFGPMLYSLREGNVTHLMLPLIMAGFLALKAGVRLRAGVLFGIAAVLKPPLALLGVFYALRGQWRVVTGGAAAMVGLALASVAVFGVDLHLLWYADCIKPFAVGPVPAFNVQSIPAAVGRFDWGAWAYEYWNAMALTKRAALIASVLSAAVLAACAYAMLRRDWRAAPSADVLPLEAWIVLTLALVLSTLSWSHYYLWLLPAFVLAYVQGEGRWRWAAVGAYALAAPAEFLSPTMKSGAFGPLTPVMISHVLTGGLVLLACLLRLRLNVPEQNSVIPDSAER